MSNTPYIGASVVKKHIDKAVSEILQPDETLLGAFHGQPLSSEGYGPYAKTKGGISAHHYLLVTDKRVIFWGRGLVSSSTDGFFYEDISSAEEARGLLLGEIVLNVRGAKERFRSMVKKDVPKAIELIREQISKSKIRTTAPENKGLLIPDQIKKLAELRDSGILTEDEFSVKKAELLKQM